MAQEGREERGAQQGLAVCVGHEDTTLQNLWSRTLSPVNRKQVPRTCVWCLDALALQGGRATHLSEGHSKPLHG